MLPCLTTCEATRIQILLYLYHLLVTGKFQIDMVSVDTILHDCFMSKTDLKKIELQLIGSFG